jgi:small-conductance mechanosensitive channel/CRP-like cAMP-binding protein
MDLTSVWRGYLDGTSAFRVAFPLALTLSGVSLLLTLFLIRPLVRFLSAREDPKIGQARLRRLTFVLVVSSLSFGIFVYFHATVPPPDREGRLAYDLSELVLFLFAGYALFELLLEFLADFLPLARGRAPVAPIFKDLIRTVFLVGLLALSVKQAFPKADIGAIVTTSAILSVVIGLALQESLGNIFSGLMLTIDRPYKPGEWISVEHCEGKVVDSNWRSTRILTRDNDVIYIPNSTMAKSNVMNFSAPTHVHLCRRELEIEFGVQPNKVRHVLVAMMSHLDGVLAEPAPDVFVREYGDSEVNYELRFWIDDYARRPRIESDVMRMAWYHLKREGISMAHPVQEIYLKRERTARRPEEDVALLKRVDILRPLKEEELVMLAEDLSHQLFAKGEAVCKQGDPGSTFYIVKSGSVSVIVRGGDGVEAEVARLGPGTYFGEMSLLTGDPRTSTCRAIEDSELLCLDRDSFSVLLQENPPVAQAMSEILASRSQATQARLAQERETMVSRRAKEDDGGSHRIFEKIRSIFGFKR